MPLFTIPSIADIGTRIRTAFRAYLPGTDAFIEPNNLSVSGKTFSLGLYEAYQRILYLYRQLFASTADGYHLINRHAAEYGIVQKPSTAATGNIIVAQAPGDDDVLPVGFLLQRDDGVSYAAAEATTASNNTFVIAVQCTTTGANTNDVPGATYSIAPQANVTLAATTGFVDDGGLGGGADEETIEALRGRVLQRKRFTPMCGANSDYERWALEVPGVTRAFASGFSNLPPGVVIYPLFDTTRDQGFPLQSDLDAVAAHLDLVKIVAARRFVAAASPLQIDVVLTDLAVDTTANRAAIATQLANLFAEKAAVATADDPLLFRRQWIEGAVDRALGLTGSSLVAPAADIQVPTGSLPFLGLVSYV